MVDPEAVGQHKLCPVLDMKSRQEAAQTTLMGWEQSHPKAHTGYTTPHHQSPRRDLEAHLTHLIRSAQAGGMLQSGLCAGAQLGGARPGSAPETLQLGTNSSAQAHVLLKPRFQLGLRHSHCTPMQGERLMRNPSVPRPKEPLLQIYLPFQKLKGSSLPPVLYWSLIIIFLPARAERG